MDVVLASPGEPEFESEFRKGCLFRPLAEIGVALELLKKSEYQADEEHFGNAKATGWVKVFPYAVLRARGDQ